MKTKLFILLTILGIKVVNAQPRNLITNEVKILVREINTARADPYKYSIDKNIVSERLDTLSIKDSLTISYRLCKKAHSYAEYLANSKYNKDNITCSHSTLGYNESIAFNTSLDKICKQLILDKNSLFKGHRKHLLGINNKDTQIGIGIGYIHELDWYVVVIVTE
jgi:hypothetical protein